MQFLLLASWLIQQPDLPPSVASLVEAERSFARMSVDRGVKEAFLAFFSEDGINFTPRPTKTREYFQKLTKPGTATLDWQPILAEVSASGDLGYTTGPYQRTDPSKPGAVGYGYFFSVWKLQPGRTWKVVLDAGIRTPGPDKPIAPAFRALQSVEGAATRDVYVDGERSAILRQEKKLGRQNSRGDLDDFLALLDDDARLHRAGAFPVLGKGAIRDYLAAKLLALKWDPDRVEVARSGDLAYSYGSYELRGSGAPKGYYAHIWRRRGGSGSWKLALDTTIELP